MNYPVDSSQQAFQPFQYWQLRYWLTWLGLGFIFAVSKLPYFIQRHLGNGLGLFAYYVMSRRRRIAEKNISRCFPHELPTTQDAYVKDCFRSVAIAIFETAMSWWATPARLQSLCRLHGVEHLDQALEKNKGVLLLSAHFAGLEIGGRLLSLHYPFGVMYKRHRNPLFDAIMRSSRQRHYQAAFQQTELRSMIRFMKNKHVCWYAPDQDLGSKGSVFAPFMGVTTASTIAPARIAKLSGVLVVPFFALRRKDGGGFDLHIYPALEDYPGDDALEDATKINKLIEAQVRKAPEQYLWLHRRFKTRPAGEASFYD